MDQELKQERQSHSGIDHIRSLLNYHVYLKVHYNGAVKCSHKVIQRTEGNGELSWDLFPKP